MEHAFEVFVTGASLDEHLANRLYEAGCDDSAVADDSPGVLVLMFDREADTLGEAVVSAIRDIKRAKLGLTVVRVEPPQAAFAALDVFGSAVATVP